jgi:hypothetical protein
MSDIVSETAKGGSISPRNIDTKVYRVVHPLPGQGLPGPGARLAVWPQGEVYGVNINGGLRPIKITEIAEWRAAGLIEPWVEDEAIPRGIG